MIWDIVFVDMAFKICGSVAIKEAVREAGPQMLEPMMKLEVVTPDDYLGDVVGEHASALAHNAAVRVPNQPALID